MHQSDFDGSKHRRRVAQRLAFWGTLSAVWFGLLLLAIWEAQ